MASIFSVAYNTLHVNDERNCADYGDIFNIFLIGHHKHSQ